MSVHFIKSFYFDKTETALWASHFSLVNNWSIEIPLCILDTGLYFFFLSFVKRKEVNGSHWSFCQGKFTVTRSRNFSIKRPSKGNTVISYNQWNTLDIRFSGSRNFPIIFLWNYLLSNFHINLTSVILKVFRCEIINSFVSNAQISQLTGITKSNRFV